MILVGGVQAAKGVNLLLNFILLLLGLNLLLILFIVLIILKPRNVCVVDLDERLGTRLGLFGVRNVGDLEIARNVHAVDLARTSLRPKNPIGVAAILNGVQRRISDRRVCGVVKTNEVKS